MPRKSAKRATNTAEARILRMLNPGDFGNTTLRPARNSAAFANISERAWVTNYRGRRAEYSKFDDLIRLLPPLQLALDYRKGIALLPDHNTQLVVDFRHKKNRIVDVLSAMRDRLRLSWTLPDCLGDQHKYGDEFRQIVISPYRVEDYYQLPREKMAVVVDEKYKRPIGYRQGEMHAGFSAEGDVDYALWEIHHWKHSLSALYGKSLMEPSIDRIESYRWMSFAIVLARVLRSMDRYEKRVDMSGVEDDEGKQLDRMAAAMNSDNVTKFLDDNGNLRSHAGFMSFAHDVYTRVYPNSAADVGTKVLQGQKGLERIDDAELIREEALAPLGVPIRLLSLGKETIARAELNEQDRNLIGLAMLDQVRVKEICLLPLCRIELILNGIDITKPQYKFDLDNIILADLDTTDRKKQAEIRKLDAETYKILKDTGHFNRRFLQHQIFDLTDAQMNEIERELAKEQEEEPETDPATDPNNPEDDDAENL